MNEIPKLIVGHRVKIFYSDDFVLEGKVVDAHLNLFLLTEVESSRGNGKRKEKDQLVNNLCQDFVRLEATDTGRAEAMNDIPKYVVGKHVRLYFTAGYVMEGVIDAMNLNLLVLHEVKSIGDRGARSEKDQIINNMCSRFERLEILD